MDVTLGLGSSTILESLAQFNMRIPSICLQIENGTDLGSLNTFYKVSDNK